MVIQSFYFIHPEGAGNSVQTLLLTVTPLVTLGGWEALTQENPPLLSPGLSSHPMRTQVR